MKDHMLEKKPLGFPNNQSGSSPQNPK